MGNPYSFNAKPVQRSKGESAVAKAAYQSGEKLRDERTGRRHNYIRKKQGVAWSEILAPAHAPGWAKNRRELWNRAETAEKRKDGQPARRIILALPKELTHEQRREYVRQYINEQFVARGMIADFAIHLPEVGKNQDNHHLHLLVTMRDVGPEGFGQKNRSWNQKSLLEEWRKTWAEHTNRALVAAGFEGTWDHRTLEAQGIDRLPQVHLGPNVIEMEEKGIPTDRASRALRVAETNQLLQEMREIDREISNEKRHRQSEAGKKPAGDSRAASPAPAGKSENHQVGKGIGGHEPGTEKASSSTTPKSRKTRGNRHSGQVVPRWEGPQMTNYSFQAAVESRRRQKAWAEQSKSLLAAPEGTSFQAAERRRELFFDWQWLSDPSEIRRRAVSDSRQGGEFLSRLGHEQYLARQLVQSRDREAYYLRQKIETLKPYQIFEKKRLAAELGDAEKALVAAKEEQKALADAEKKLLTSCPAEVVDKFRHKKEEEREKALADLLTREAREIEEERRREEAEARARQERQAMQPTTKHEKTPGGWTPPRPC